MPTLLIPITTVVPLETYLRYPGEYEPDAEYVDGEIELRSVGEYDHATWQGAINQWFTDHGKEWNVRVRVELRVKVSDTRYRIPDVVVWDRNRPVEQILTHPPIAVFEVLSPEDRMSRLMVKLADYEAMGIRTIRTIVPATRTISEFRQGELIPIQARTEQLPDSACRLDWNRIEELLDL
jgi:Uma2 family endonuclease